jgi:hypothetical protein
MKVEGCWGFVKLAGVHVAFPMHHLITVFAATWTSGVRDGVLVKLVQFVDVNKGLGSRLHGNDRKVNPLK